MRGGAAFGHSQSNLGLWFPSLECLPTPTQHRHTFQIWLHSMTSSLLQAFPSLPSAPSVSCSQSQLRGWAGACRAWTCGDPSLER